VDRRGLLTILIEAKMDEQIRTAAFEWVEKQMNLHGGFIPRKLLDQGFEYQGKRITLTGPQGIWKPAFMELPISIYTRPDGPYPDFMMENGFLVYRYRGTNPNHKDNVGLRTAMQRRIPLIYFYRVEPGKCLAEWPVYIEEDHPEELAFIVSIGAHNIVYKELELHQGQLFLEAEDPLHRRYATAEAIYRLHQAEFRVRVLTAYKDQCAFCRLRHIQLLDAAHIIPDGEDGGEPIVPNGLSLCKIHHAAFDSDIVGLNPDYKIIVRKDILEEIDGPMLKYGIQEMHGHKIILPGKRLNWPDRERLSIRYERFMKAV
jgi:putative restriction endonuclease